MAAILLLAGCGGGGEEKARVDAAAGRDSTVQGGYSSPPGFALPFRTVLPDGFRADPNLEGAGDAIRFVWAPGGEARDSSVVFVRVLDEGSSEAAARELVRTAAERKRIPGDRTELQPRNVHPWAVVEYPIASMGTTGERVQGWVALGRRNERWFYVIVQAPVSMWPRFEGAAETILSEWRWAGTDGRDEGLAGRRAGDGGAGPAPPSP
ncbi:MAG: hypothetical protein KY444_09615 [Gemmatimonadetes bacterium]|nr:hypothetical protein [Gemmatimonadota bacterium]